MGGWYERIAVTRRPCQFHLWTTLLYIRCRLNEHKECCCVFSSFNDSLLCVMIHYKLFSGIWRLGPIMIVLQMKETIRYPAGGLQLLVVGNY